MSKRSPRVFELKLQRLVHVSRLSVIRWKEDILHGKHYKNKPKIYDLKTECIEHIEYIEFIKYIGYILDIYTYIYVYIIHIYIYIFIFVCVRTHRNRTSCKMHYLDRKNEKVVGA